MKVQDRPTPTLSLKKKNMQTRTRLEREAVGTERARQGAAGEDHLETQNRPPEEASMDRASTEVLRLQQTGPRDGTH